MAGAVGDPLSDGDLNAVKAWVANGADAPGSCGTSSDDAGVADTSAPMDSSTAMDGSHYLEKEGVEQFSRFPRKLYHGFGKVMVEELRLAISWQIP